jgi:F-type H+-transporting ATPase subunit a
MIEPKIPEISLNPDVLFTIASIDITNSALASVSVSIIIFFLSLFFIRNLQLIPSKGQLVFEEIVGFFYNQTKVSFGSEKRAKQYLALIITIFLFVLIANQFTLIPLVQSVVTDGVSVFKTPTAHLSQTLTLSLVVVVISHVAAFMISPLKHISNVFNLGEILKVRSLADLPNMFLQIFLGILNIIGEFAKVISLSARLFGNVFAGEVMVGVIAGLSFYTMFLVPISFMAISIFSGIIQAFVFAFLSLSFISGTITSVES